MNNVISYWPYVLGAVLALVSLLLSFAWRTVVQTNVVHIVQSRKSTTSYGAQREAGNVYYAIPPYIPVFGLTVTELPVNIFNLDLNNYQAYDKDRVPFNLHVTAFFRIKDTDRAAERVSNFQALHEQLMQVIKGAVRKILATHDIHSIMTSRATFGQAFTEEVAAELENWGVEPVKNMELMDIKDAEGSQVIANIMAKKSSHIEMESRTEVAANHRAANVAEIQAKRETQEKSIEAQRIVGEKTAEAERLVGVSQEKSKQAVQEEAAATKAKEMAVVSVQTQRQAEIKKAAGITLAEEQAAVAAKTAEGRRDQARLEAEGRLEAAKRDAEAQLELAKRQAEGVRVNGSAKADAETAMAAAVKAMQLAPVEAQIVLAKEIGANANYQTYLVSVRQVEANEKVGVAQAAALEKAEIKVFANTGDAPSGISSVGELLGSKGGTKLAATLEGLKATVEGAALVKKVTGQAHVPNGNGAR